VSGKSSPDKSKNPNGGLGKAPHAGAGAGTIFLAIIESLPDDFPGKRWLALLAPSISIGAGGAWLWASRAIDRRKRRNDTDIALLDAEMTLRQRMYDDTLSSEDRAEAKAELEALRHLELEAKIERAKSLVTKRDQSEEGD